MRDFILSTFITKRGTCDSSKINLLSNYHDDLVELVPGCDGDDKERLFWLSRGITEAPVCKTCGGKTKWKGLFTVGKKSSYPLFCSPACRAKDPDVTEKLKDSQSNLYQDEMLAVSNKDELIEIIKRRYYNGSKTNGNFLRALTPNIKSLLNTLTPKLKSNDYKEKIYWVMNGFEDYPNWCSCGNPITQFRKEYKWKFCSNKCKANDPDFQKQRIETTTSRYGTSNNNAKTKQTNIKKYGVENVSQIPAVADKILKNGHRKKVYTFPSGRKVFVQGYEPQAIDELLKTYNEDDIVLDRKQIPTFWWNDKTGKKHRYFPDIFIPKDNLVVEVKSKWTYDSAKDVNERKFERVRESTYNFRLMILDKYQWRILP